MAETNIVKRKPTIAAVTSNMTDYQIISFISPLFLEVKVNQIGGKDLKVLRRLNVLGDSFGKLCKDCSIQRPVLILYCYVEL